MIITIKFTKNNNINDHFNTKKNYTTYNDDNSFWPYRNENIWRLIDNIILIKS